MFDMTQITGRDSPSKFDKDSVIGSYLNTVINVPTAIKIIA